MGQIAVLGREGHVAVKWDESLPETVAEAKVAFDELLGSGAAMFRTVASAGTATPTREQIREFDPSAQEIVATRPLQGG